MMKFLAIDPEAKNDDGKPVVLPFNYKRFHELMRSKGMFKLPKFYCGVCSVCLKNTFYEGTNRGRSLQVIPE
jgi:hypothetical protein